MKEPAIKIRSNSSTKSRDSPSRAKIVRELKELGYERCKDKYRYGSDVQQRVSSLVLKECLVEHTEQDLQKFFSRSEDEIHLLQHAHECLSLNS